MKNILLIHGTFADGSGWEGVFRILTVKGYNVTVVQNPCISLEEDVTAVKRAMDRETGHAFWWDTHMAVRSLLKRDRKSSFKA